MGRAAGNRDEWWGADKNRSAAQVEADLHEREPHIPFEPTVVAVEDEFVVVDKPPFLPATPNGRIVANTVQERLRKQLGEPEIVCMHRLDRLTSGLLLLSRNPETRGIYQQLFHDGSVQKTYECLTVMPDDWERGETREITLYLLNEPGQRGVRVVEPGTPGAKEARTRVTFLGPVAADIGDVLGGLGGATHSAGCACGTCGTVMQVGHWRLEPHTGRTHQLRATMDYLEYPILGEDTYGVALRRAPQNFQNLLASGIEEPGAVANYGPVLRLLATELSFIDPIGGEERKYRTGRDVTQAV